MEEEGMMTEAQFDKKLREWAFKVRWMAGAALIAGTHNTGKLNLSLKKYVDQMRGNVGRHIAFRFEQYGVFRQYGAGRGWIIVNGKPVPGHRVFSLRSIRNGSYKRTDAYRKLTSEGWTNKQAQSAKVTHEKGGKPRTPLDWLDGRIEEQKMKLANLAQDYYGDFALKNVLREIDKAKIVKHG